MRSITQNDTTLAEWPATANRLHRRKACNGCKILNGRGLRNDQQALERGIPLSFWVIPKAFKLAATDPKKH